MGTQGHKVQEALAFLQKTQAEGGGGGSVYEHLTQLVMQVLEERPVNAVDLLETALLVKRSGAKAPTALTVAPHKSAGSAARAVAAASLYGAAEVPIDPVTGEPVETDPPNEYEWDDVLAASMLVEALGVGLGRTAMMDVARAAQRLGEDPARRVATVRFFGKFLGLNDDYYVFETTLQEPSVEQLEPEMLGEGQVPSEVNTGANQHVYFVASYPGGPLTQLPPVTPAQIKAARTLKKLLTGRLSSQVSSYPVFPGNEANYLRAQIARIAASTVVAPAGMWVAGEDGALEKAEDYEPPAAREMGVPANWVHKHPHLKKQGRCELHRHQGSEDVEEGAEVPCDEEEQEEGPEALASLENDTQLEGQVPAWSSLFSSSAEVSKAQVAGVRSNAWPGAVAAAQGARYACMYVGWGIKAGPFVPAPPPPVAGEYDGALVESVELPPKPAPQEQEDGGEDGDG